MLLASVLVLLAILSLNLYLYSSMHVHNRLSSQPCAFSQLEKSPASQPVAAIEPPAPSYAAVWIIAVEFVARSQDESPNASGRAPPSNS